MRMSSKAVTGIDICFLHMKPRTDPNDFITVNQEKYFFFYCPGCKRFSGDVFDKQLIYWQSMLVSSLEQEEFPKVI